MSALPASRPTKSFPIAVRPRIAAHVIAAFFPETCFVFGEKAHALDPLRGFPCVELRNDQPHGPAVLRRYWPTAMRVSKQRVFFEEISDGNVCGPPVVVRQSEHKLRFRF